MASTTNVTSTTDVEIVRRELKAKQWDFDSLLAMVRVLPLLDCRPFRYHDRGALHYDITYRGMPIQSRQFKAYTK